MADYSPTPTPIFTHIDARIPVLRHDHVAILHRGGASAAWGAEFLGEGLRRGQRCCYLAPASLHVAMRKRLGLLGFDVEWHLSDQTLQFPPEPLRAGNMLDWGKKFFAEAEIAHVPAIRWLEERAVSTLAGISVPQYFELHVRLNYLVKQYPAAALCLYDIENLEIPRLFSAIAVHRHLLIEGVLVRDNPFYIPAEKFVAMNPEDRERDLRGVFREVGFDLEKLLLTLAGYGQLQRTAQAGS